MESLVQRLGWRGNNSSSNSGYCPPGCSLLAPDSGDEEEGDTTEATSQEEDRRLASQLAKLDKSYQKFSIRDKQ